MSLSGPCHCILVICIVTVVYKYFMFLFLAITFPFVKHHIRAFAMNTVILYLCGNTISEPLQGMLWSFTNRASLYLLFHRQFHPLLTRTLSENKKIWEDKIATVIERPSQVSKSKIINVRNVAKGCHFVLPLDAASLGFWQFL